MKLFRINDKYIKGLIICGITLFILIPIFDVFSLIFEENSSYLKILIKEKIIITYLLNTFELIIKVAFFSIAIGFFSAYIITMYDFKYKKIYKVLLTLPLAIPVYVGAYTYTSIYYDIKILEIIFKNDFFMNGSVFIYTMFLYPYIYLASRSYLRSNLVEYIEAASTLGSNRIKIFFKIIFPLSWPAILGSTLLVIFETLSDFAVVEYYGIETVSRIITDAWLGLGQKETAAKVSIILLFSLFVLIFIEKLIRYRKRYHGISNKKNKPQKITKKQAIFFYTILTSVILLGVILPIFEMIKSLFIKSSYIDVKSLLIISGNTLWTILITIVIVIILASLMASITNTYKVSKGFFSTIGVLGYSIPSLVLALGVYVFSISIDKFIYLNLDFIPITPYILTGTRIALITALVIKFISIAFSNYLNTLDKANKNIFDASSTLNHNFIGTFFRINVPMLKKTTIYVFIILFIDLIKELTLTISLRPFNFKTLSTEVYRYAGNEMIEVAAIPSLVIVVICTVMIIYLEAGENNARTKKH